MPRRSSGMAMVSSAVTPGILTSANPTELREATALCGADVATAFTVIRRVVKERVGKETTWPATLLEPGPRGTTTGWPPSKVRVTLVIHRSGSPVTGWTRVTDPTVLGLSRVTCHHCPSCGPKESSNHDVSVLPSRAAAGRLSGR
jgi:hypothetical protein